LTVDTVFDWLEVLNSINEVRGGLLIRLHGNHAVCVVGLRVVKESRRVELAIANSLPGYEINGKSGRIIWVTGEEMIQNILTLNPKTGNTELGGRGIMTTQEAYLVRWDIAIRNYLASKKNS